MKNALDKLFIKHGTDKSSEHHNYSSYYETHFEKFRFSPIKMVAVGIGGYEYPDRGGGDIKAFSEYFPHAKAQIHAIDIFDKSGVKFDQRVSIYKGSQDDGDFLMSIMMKCGEPDIVIDDASHFCKPTIQTFKHLFPWLKSGGVYVIEDLEGSFYEEHGYGGTKNFMDFKAETPLNLTRELLNCVNAKFLPSEFQAQPQYEISAMHFYQNIVFIVKK